MSPTHAPFRCTGLARTALAVALLILGGCAGVSREECASMDWRLVGYEDGAAGLPPARIGRHRSACAEHGVSPDLDAYLAGRQEGLRTYCTPHNGYALGSRGKGLAVDCPADLADPFAAAHGQGLEVHEARSDVRRLDRQLRKVEADLSGHRDEVARLEAELIADGTGNMRRLSALNEIRLHAQDIETLEEQLGELSHEHAHAKERLDRRVARSR